MFFSLPLVVARYQYFLIDTYEHISPQEKLVEACPLDHYALLPLSPLGEATPASTSILSTHEGVPCLVFRSLQFQFNIFIPFYFKMRDLSMPGSTHFAGQVPFPAGWGDGLAGCYFVVCP